MNAFLESPRATTFLLTYAADMKIVGRSYCKDPEIREMLNEQSDLLCECSRASLKAEKRCESSSDSLLCMMHACLNALFRSSSAFCMCRPELGEVRYPMSVYVGHLYMRCKARVSFYVGVADDLGRGG
jgi:hypothetical protein